MLCMKAMREAIGPIDSKALSLPASDHSSWYNLPVAHATLMSRLLCKRRSGQLGRQKLRQASMELSDNCCITSHLLLNIAASCRTQVGI